MPAPRTREVEIDESELNRGAGGMQQRAARQGGERNSLARPDVGFSKRSGAAKTGGVGAWVFRTVFFLPLAVWGMTSRVTSRVRGTVTATSSGLRSAAGSMSGSMEMQMAKKLYFAFSDLFSGFLELGALIATMTLLFWVSGLFLGLALCSVLVAFACLYVLSCAVGMNWMLDRVRVYLRDCMLLRVCSGAIPVVSVLKGLRFTTGVTVHFSDKSMVWILHAGNWVVRLCWRSVLEPMRYLPQPPNARARTGHREPPFSAPDALHAGERVVLGGSAR
ncbi:hypothetical protein T484DRAFT_2020822 [Baffinella frigidus]|nr:hypothetical protein T484DRAFT_2020822 [Cryptophyta sp. CCMP2293]